MTDAPYVDNEISGTVTGGVIQAHTITGGVRVGDGRPVARSAYLEQVRRIAPKQLEDRDAELAELASFCTAPEAGPYVWWRAAAWAGKSALLSWFVLGDPPPGVRVVSFFITARYHGQSDRVGNLASSRVIRVVPQPRSRICSPTGCVS